MNPHREPDWKRLAFEREIAVADLTMEVASVRAALRKERRRAWQTLLLNAAGCAIGAFAATAFVLSFSREPATPPLTAQTLSPGLRCWCFVP